MAPPITPEAYYLELSRRYDVIPCRERNRWLRYCWTYDLRRRDQRSSAAALGNAARVLNTISRGSTGTPE